MFRTIKCPNCNSEYRETRVRIFRKYCETDCPHCNCIVIEHYYPDYKIETRRRQPESPLAKIGGINWILKYRSN
jgi:hypothetical protein